METQFNKKKNQFGKEKKGFIGPYIRYIQNLSVYDWQCNGGEKIGMPEI